MAGSYGSVDGQLDISGYDLGENFREGLDLVMKWPEEKAFAYRERLDSSVVIVRTY